MTNEFQQKVQEFLDEMDMNHPIENRIIDLCSETGEVAKEINKMSNYGAKKPEYREEITMEIGDVFYSLITVANYYDIDLINSLNLVLGKYAKRIKNGGHPGSDNNKVTR